MAQKKSFLESRGFKIFMKYLYGLGAAVVIGGALFKIMHWPFANQMLIAGMGTEVLVFFVSAFEPLHKEVDWAKVYPQLREDEEEDFLLEEGEEGVDPASALSFAEAGLSKVDISPDLFDSLTGSLNGLKDNVSKLSEIQDASVATQEYATNVKSASSKMGQLNDGFSTSLEAMSTLASSASNAAENAKGYQEEVARVTKNLSSLNAVYEVELQDAQEHIKALNKFYGSMTQAMNNMTEASKEAETFKDQMGALSRNLQSLNKVYGGMLSAMGASNNA